MDVCEHNRMKSKIRNVIQRRSKRSNIERGREGGKEAHLVKHVQELHALEHDALHSARVSNQHSAREKKGGRERQNK